MVEINNICHVVKIITNEEKWYILIEKYRVDTENYERSDGGGGGFHWYQE